MKSAPRPKRVCFYSRICAIFPVLILLAGLAAAQNPSAIQIKPAVNPLPLPIDRGSSALWQSLLKLHTRASLIMFTAHPDDEDGGMLTYETRGQGSRAALFTLNRGEGGQNVMSNNYWDQLGLVRTEELLAADRYYGVQQFWSSVIDYGFSKTREEALEKWGHDRVLYDSVRVVRMDRPLVVTSVFVGNPSDGHGHHQVAGQMAQEVFNAAGDPNVFPDQIKAGLRPWTPLKMYARVPFFSVSPKGMYDYATGKWLPVRFHDYLNNTWIEGVPSTNVEVPEGTYDPTLGLDFVQVSREGLGYQKSQNGGTALPLAGVVNIPYHRYGSRVQVPDKENSFFDGIDTSLMGIASLAKGDNVFLRTDLSDLNSLVEKAMAEFSTAHPEKTAPALADGLKKVTETIDQVNSSSLDEESKYDVLHELRIKQAQFNDALAEALGLSINAAVAPEHKPSGPFARFMGPQETFQTAIPGQKFGVNVHVVNQSSVPVELKDVQLKPGGGETWNIKTDEPFSSASIDNSAPTNVHFEVEVPENAKPTEPYFSRPNIEQPYYNINDKQYAELPLAPYPLSAWVDFTYQGTPIRVAQVVQTIKRETGPGNVYEPLIVAPAISVSVSPSAGIVPVGKTSFSLTALVHSNVKGAAQGTLKLNLPASWRSEPATADFHMNRDGEEQSVDFTVFPTQVEEKPYDITAVAEYNGHSYERGYVTVGYPGLRPYNLYRAATYRTTGVNVKVANDLNVGYVMGTGDEVPQSLENLGIKVHFLTDQDLASANLSKYDVILLGIRTYAARPALITYNGRLLDYVKNGGVVIVQYQTPQYDHDFGPYTYTLTNDPEKVVDETSQVQILDPNSALMKWPNQITSKDFNGWVEERGHDFMKSWDPKYVALTETHDPDQDPQKGGLLYARYGKGAYIYVAYALYRQLPEGVPGAYRLMANLISLPKNPDANREASASTTASK